MSNTDKVILITGAASGIGAATAAHLVSQGYRLWLSDLSIDQISLRPQKDRGLWAHANVRCVDVSDSEAVSAWIKACHQEAGRIDGLFNCAGINPTSIPLETTSDAYFDKLMATNVKGTFNCCRAVIPFLKSGGTIVNVSSILGLHPLAQNSVYCATKYAIVGFSKSLALELGPSGVRVNVVAPGYIRTPTNSGVVEGEKGIKAQEAQVAMGRMGTADEVASVVGFLFSDAAAYMNGSVVEVNGGTG